jgi:hypothetical protein
MLADYPLGSNQSDITFSNIPGTFRHIRVLGKLRSDRASGGESVGIRLNGDSTSSNYYSGRAIVSFDSANAEEVVTSEHMGASYWSLTGCCGDNAPSNAFGSIDYFFADYVSNQNKSISCLGEHLDTTASEGMKIELAAGSWADTSPIRSIQLYPLAGGTVWLAGSRATLYGMSS